MIEEPLHEFSGVQTDPLGPIVVLAILVPKRDAPILQRHVTLGLVRANNFPQENVKNAPRMNPHTQPFNLAVPGYNTEQIRDISALNHRDTLNSTVSQILYEDILGEGNPTFRKRPEASTQLDQIRTVAPSMLVLWAANNDFLGAVTETNVNPPNGVTPPDELYPTYTDLVMKAKKITPDVVLATVPDATAFPTFIPLTGKALGEGFFGYQIKLALANKTTLYETTPIPLTSAEGIDLQGAATSLNKYISAQRAMENPEVTHPIFVLDPKMKNALLPPEIAFIQSSIAQFNEVVRQVAAAQEVPVVRMDLLLDRLGTPPCRVITNVGEILPGLKGLLFSPDGIHATDLGYGLLAHAFRNGINGRIQLQGSFGGLTSTSQKHGPLPSTITVPTGCLE